MQQSAVLRFVTVSALTLWASVATGQQPVVVVDPWSPDAAIGWRAAVVTEVIDPWAEAEDTWQMVIVDPWKARPEDVSPVDVTDPWAEAARPTALSPGPAVENPW